MNLASVIGWPFTLIVDVPLLLVLNVIVTSSSIITSLIGVIVTVVLVFSTVNVVWFVAAV